VAIDALNDIEQATAIMKRRLMIRAPKKPSRAFKKTLARSAMSVMVSA
jgi:hypothetical protein